MKKLLHIIASPRGSESRTLKISAEVLRLFKAAYPEGKIDELDLFAAKLPELTIQPVNGKYLLLSGKDISPELQPAWQGVELAINRFLAADIYLISAPMWNFGVPYPLKHYIDIILQPKYLFQYTAQGPQGLVKNKKMIVVTSRGGDYSNDSPAKAFDFQEPYLRTVFGFVGIADLTFINAQPMDAAGAAVRDQKIKEALAQVGKIKI